MIDPDVVRMPLVSTRSLIPTGTPASGPTVRPAMMSASTAFACCRATSGVGVQNAPRTGLSFSIRASTASVTSVGDNSLPRIFAARVTASMRQISFGAAAPERAADGNRGTRRDHEFAPRHSVWFAGFCRHLLPPYALVELSPFRRVALEKREDLCGPLGRLLEG